MRAVFLLFCFILMFNEVCAREQKPLREECIVKYEISWEESIDWKSSVLDKEEKLRLITKTFSRLYRLNIKDHPPPGFSFRGKEKENIYALFKGKCNNRFDISKQIMGLIDKENSEFSISVIEKTYRPGPETIDHYGRFWRDG